MLTDKVAVIYGAGGGIGGAVARTFARERAKVFLTGRHLPSVEIVAKQIRRGRRICRGGGGGRPRRAGGGRPPPVIRRGGGPRRHLVQRGRDSERGDPWHPAGRPRRKAVLLADHQFRPVVLLDRTPGGPSDGAERIRGDHDRHRHACEGGPPAGGRVRPGAGGQGGAYSRPVCRARTSRHPGGRSATSGDAGDTNDQGRLRAPRRGIGDDLGRVAGDAREQDPPSTVDDARRRWRTWPRSWHPIRRAGSRGRPST